jgi:hypothetical protein
LSDFEQEELYNEARQPNYHFSNYIQLRPAEDFAKGALLNKRKVSALFAFPSGLSSSDHGGLPQTSKVSNQSLVDKA